MLLLGALALAGLVVGQSTCGTDLGNGVHVPGQLSLSLRVATRIRLTLSHPAQATFLPIFKSLSSTDSLLLDLGWW